jgi:hypothetical protein
MKIRLSMRGGIYGSLAFEPVDAEVVSPQFGRELKAVMSKYQHISEHGKTAGELAQSGVRTERQTIEIELTPEGGESRIYSFGESSLEADPDLKRLFHALWKHSRPLPEK